MKPEPLEYENANVRHPPSLQSAVRLAAYAIAMLAGGVILGSGIIANALQSSGGIGAIIAIVGGVVLFVASSMFLLGIFDK